MRTVTATYMGGLRRLQEARTKVLNVKAFDVATVRRMVTFMYTEEYEVGSINETSGSAISHETEVSQPEVSITELHLPPQQLDRVDVTEALLRHVRVNAIADYYDIPKLTQLANSKIRCLLGDSWQAESFSHVVEEVLDSTGNVALQEILSSTAADHIGELVESQSFADLEVMSDFAIKVLRSCALRIHETESQLQYNRSVCKEAFRAGRVIDNIDNCLRTLSACINDLVVIQGERL
ncbi:hypothetical protein NW759_016441 [Fusarium solani]|nr:hypothetical protein NW759_016441 [Fusarium solani]